MSKAGEISPSNKCFQCSLLYGEDHELRSARERLFSLIGTVYVIVDDRRRKKDSAQLVQINFTFFVVIKHCTRHCTSGGLKEKIHQKCKDNAVLLLIHRIAVRVLLDWDRQGDSRPLFHHRVLSRGAATRRYRMRRWILHQPIPAGMSSDRVERF